MINNDLNNQNTSDVNDLLKVVKEEESQDISPSIHEDNTNHDSNL